MTDILKKQKLTIGEFSRFCQVTVKTLRHYDKLGLLVPSEVDEWTHYRYYDVSQMQQLNAMEGIFVQPLPSIIVAVVYNVCLVADSKKNGLSLWTSLSFSYLCLHYGKG